MPQAAFAVPSAFLYSSDEGKVLDVRELGTVRESLTRQGRPRWHLDFGRVQGIGHCRIWSLPDRSAFTCRADAEALLTSLQMKLAEQTRRGKGVAEVLAPYLPQKAKPNLVQSRLQDWLGVKRDQAQSGVLSMTYVRELERWCRGEDHFGFWWGLSIHEISAGQLDDFARWLGKRRKRDRRGQPTDDVLSVETRRKVLGGFSSFVRWLARREDIERVPLFPSVPREDYSPTIISSQTQDAVLEAIPWEVRGAYLIMGHMGLRPGEVRALNVEDYREGWLSVEHGMQGTTHKARRGTPKTRRHRRLPCPPAVVEWLEAHWPPAERLRLRGTPLCVNPTGRKDGGRWTWSSLDRTWKRACAHVGVEVRMYEGTKHAMATDALRRGVPERHLQAYLGHADPRSTRRYAKLADEGLLEVIRRSPDAPPVALSVRQEKGEQVRGVEVGPWRGGRDSKGSANDASARKRGGKG